MPDILLHAARPTALWHAAAWPGQNHEPAVEGSDAFEASDDAPWRLLASGPGQWLFIARRDGLIGPPNVSQTALAFTDVTQAWVCIEVRGDDAAEFLAQCCDVETEDSSSAFQRVLGAPAFIDAQEREDLFHLYIARSYAAWVHERLVSSARNRATAQA